MVTIDYMISSALRFDTSMSCAMLRACGEPAPRSCQQFDCLGPSPSFMRDIREHNKIKHAPMDEYMRGES